MQNGKVKDEDKQMLKAFLMLIIFWALILFIYYSFYGCGASINDEYYYNHVVDTNKIKNEIDSLPTINNPNYDSLSNSYDSLYQEMIDSLSFNK